MTSHDILFYDKGYFIIKLSHSSQISKKVKFWVYPSIPGIFTIRVIMLVTEMSDLLYSRNMRIYS